MPDKNIAAQALARMQGWEAAQRVEVTHINPLTSYLRELRAKAIEVSTTSERTIEDQPLTP